MATLAEMQTELTEVKTAISAIYAGGQSYGVDGQQVQKADLRELRRIKKELESNIARLSRGMVRVSDVREGDV